MAADLLHPADQDTPSFRASHKSIDVVCAGDSITGWNNYGSVEWWPYPTYPEYLQQKCEPLGLRIANGGIAGEISQNGIGQVRDCHNEQLRGYCGQSQVLLVDICSHLRDEHFADEAARHFEKVLEAAASEYPHVIAVTHVPPFREAAWYRGKPSDDNFLPYFASKAVGDVVQKVMQAHPQSNLVVLCGHTHGGGEIKVLDNLRVLTGEAEYGKLRINGILAVE